MKAIINTNVVLEKGIIFDGVVVLDGNRIINVGKKQDVEVPLGAEIVDGQGLFTCPGFIDIHNHGSVKNFFLDNPEECCNHFLSHGETTVLPTYYQTYSAEEMIEGTKKLKEFSKTGNGRIIKGLYMEGP